MVKEVSDRIAIGAAATAEELRQLAGQGYRTVVDLCTPAENKQLSPDLVREAGMRLEQVPVAVNALMPETMRQFDQALDAAEGRVYVRCASGRRAALLSLLSEAERHGWSYEVFDRQARAIGADFSNPPALAQFARGYLQNAGQRGTRS